MCINHEYINRYIRPMNRYIKKRIIQSKVATALRLYVHGHIEYITLFKDIKGI